MPSPCLARPGATFDEPQARAEPRPAPRKSAARMELDDRALCLDADTRRDELRRLDRGVARRGTRLTRLQPPRDSTCPTIVMKNFSRTVAAFATAGLALVCL